MALSVIIVLFVCVLMASIKTVHFYTSIKNKKVANWFYFSSHSIMNSRSEQSSKAKKKQNLLSLLLLTTVIIGLLIVILTIKLPL